MNATIYKIVPEALWREAEKAGVFTGAAIDIADGYIHFSTAEQAVETAAKHFAGQDGLLLAAIDTAKLGSALKYENPSKSPKVKIIRIKPMTLMAVHPFRSVSSSRLKMNLNNLWNNPKTSAPPSEMRLTMGYVKPK